MPELKSALALVQELREAVRHNPLLSAEPTPRFDFRIGWCKDYDDLLALNCQSITEISEIVTRAVVSRRVLISARGGVAKTVILQRLVKEQIPDNVVPIWVDLKRWTVADYEAWNSLTTLPMKLDFLFGRLAIPTIGVAVLDALPARIGKMVFVDGLNEISGRVADSMLEALHSLVRAIPASAVVVSDRLVRRPLKDSESWQLATVLPLDEAQIRGRLTEKLKSAVLYDHADAQTRALLAMPYFLDATLNYGQLATSGPMVHEQYFRRHVLTADELAVTAKAAFDAYSQNRTRSFSIAEFRAAVGGETLQRIRETLIINGETAYFDHHLKHDYLAAVHLAKERTLWNDDVFNRVTFRASSFEVLAMTLDMLESESDADAFVRAVYDWNAYGAAYAVAEGRYRGRPRVSPHMELILLAVIAERQWDLIIATAQRSRDALRLFGTHEAQRLLDASSPDEVSAIVAEAPRGDDSFERWRSLFTRRSGSPASRADVALLTEDSVIGWTASNVLKRCTVAEREQQQVRRLTHDPLFVVRWRAVHSLGAFPSNSNAQTLLERLDVDKHEWVRYGAIRSAVELAARGDSKLRRSVLTALVQRADQILGNDRIEQEFQNSVLIDRARAPKEWPQLVIGMLARIRMNEKSGERWDRWEDLAYKVRATYETGSDN